MTVTHKMSPDGNVLTLAVEGDFILFQAQAFRDAYIKSDIQPKTCIIDMEKTKHLDSTALGMLLELREHASQNSMNIYIVNMNDVVLEIFRILNFHHLFKPEYHQDFNKVVWAANFR